MINHQYKVKYQRYFDNESGNYKIKLEIDDQLIIDVVDTHRNPINNIKVYASDDFYAAADVTIESFDYGPL